jgi:hypothetical protein
VSFFFYWGEVVRLTQGPLRDQGAPFCLGHHLWPVSHGRAYQQLRYRQHNSQDHVTTQDPALRQKRGHYWSYAAALRLSNHTHARSRKAERTIALTPVDGRVSEVMIQELAPLHDQQCVVVVWDVSLCGELRADDACAGQVLSTGSNSRGVHTWGHTALWWQTESWVQSVSFWVQELQTAAAWSRSFIYRVFHLKRARLHGEIIKSGRFQIERSVFLIWHVEMNWVEFLLNKVKVMVTLAQAIGIALLFL